MVSDSTVISDPVQQFEQAFTGRQAMMWTALPGIVTRFNAEALTCEVQPAIKGRHVTEDGSVVVENLPLLLDCPVVFPHAGGASITFPIKAGDECLVVFSCRSIDLWWLSGGTQSPAEPRMHDLSDGFVIPGPWSQKTRIGSVSTDALEIRTDDGAAVLRITPGSHDVDLVTTGKLSAAAEGSVSLTCPTLQVMCPSTTFTGAVKIQGGLTVSGGSGATATFDGAIHTTGDVTAGGISLESHVHPGDSGGTTGAPK